MDVNVFEALKKGDQVLDELKNQMPMEKLEELFEKHQDNLARQEQEQQMFGQVLNYDELQGELDALDAMIAEQQIP